MEALKLMDQPDFSGSGIPEQETEVPQEIVLGADRGDSGRGQDRTLREMAPVECVGGGWS